MKLKLEKPAQNGAHNGFEGTKAAGEQQTSTSPLHDLPAGADRFMCVADVSDCISMFSTS
jgi:hypothetical protein